ncbi:uncharacterized protein C10orf105 homolog isoform X2 [Notamacropus eugenii]
MSTEEPDHQNSPTLNPVFLINMTSTDLTSPSPLPPGEIPQPLSIIIALACIFLLLATFLLFVTLCKPAAMDPSRHSPHECMPYHPETPSEPQLRFWKRLGSLRQSIHSFRREGLSRNKLENCNQVSRMYPATKARISLKIPLVKKQRFLKSSLQASKLPFEKPSFGC